MRMAALAVVAANLKAPMRHLLLRKTTLPDKSSVRSRCERQHPTRPKCIPWILHRKNHPVAMGSATGSNDGLEKSRSCDGRGARGKQSRGNSRPPGMVAVRLGRLRQGQIMRNSHERLSRDRAAPISESPLTSAVLRPTVKFGSATTGTTMAPRSAVPESHSESHSCTPR